MHEQSWHHRVAERGRAGGIERERERGRERERERKKERKREIEKMGRARERARERDRDRQKQRQRQRWKEREIQQASQHPNIHATCQVALPSRQEQTNTILQKLARRQKSNTSNNANSGLVLAIASHAMPCPCMRPAGAHTHCLKLQNQHLPAQEHNQYTLSHESAQSVQQAFEVLRHRRQTH